MLFPILKTKRMPTPLSILPLLSPLSLKGYNVVGQIFGGQGVKSHDTKLRKVLYVENGNASGITGKIPNVIANKEICGSFHFTL